MQTGKQAGMQADNQAGIQIGTVCRTRSATTHSVDRAPRTPLASRDPLNALGGGGVRVRGRTRVRVKVR